MFWCYSLSCIQQAWVCSIRSSFAEVMAVLVLLFPSVVFSAKWRTPSVADLGHAVVLLSGAVVPQALMVVPQSPSVVLQVLMVVPLYRSGSTATSGQAAARYIPLNKTKLEEVFDLTEKGARGGTVQRSRRDSLLDPGAVRLENNPPHAMIFTLPLFHSFLSGRLMYFFSLSISFSISRSGWMQFLARIPSPCPSLR